MTDVLHASRHDVRDSRKIELITGPRAHRSQLRALRAVTNLCQANAGLAALVNKHFDRENTPPNDAEERSWLQLSDITLGRHFNEASLPLPSLTPHDASIYDSNLNRPSSQTLETSETTVTANLLDEDVAASATSISADLPDSMRPDPDSITAGGLSKDVQNDRLPETYVERAASQPEGLVAAPGQVAPPEPEEEAQLSGSTQQLLDLQTPSKPAKVAHLPSQEVQAKQAREMDEERRRRADDEALKSTRAGSSHLPLQGEQASSPSSTVGAYSATTPVPPQESPDTSPDSESAEQLEISKEVRPSPEEQREKEEHDRLLEAQKEIARKNALGDVSTADDQLRWEEREAAAREAEEKAARESVKGPEPSAALAINETQLEQPVEGVQVATTTEQMVTAPATPGAQAPSQPTLPSGATKGPDEGDNITVTPRLGAGPFSDSPRQSRDGEASGRRQTLHPDDAKDILARGTSGLSYKHEALGMHESNSSPARKNGDVLPTSTFHLTTPTSLADVLNNPEACLEKLDALKGAASDPSRDYLEPLFRIQAHDSPNINTTPLSDLIRSASKSVTTADHYAMIEERADYKILRRIYQLQNANKWSLRQMEKAKEPPQPISHQDHMMAEMKWLQKDFRVERKMKKSICAWLAQRCAAFHAADEDGRRAMQVQAKRPPPVENVEVTIETVPDLESSAEAESPEDEDNTPPTPQNGSVAPLNLVVPPELRDTVTDLQKSGKLGSALLHLPVARFEDLSQSTPARPPLTAVSKYAVSKVLPQLPVNPCKRSRYDYEDDDELLSSERESKRLRDDRALPAEDEDAALFHPENKHLRDRLHANTAFRPPSEFVMPSTSFYEFRNGSQWIWEDDQKLRKLAKDYSFNWSLIADELALPAMHKSSAERRTPWECFERWVELEQLPAEMKKTVYFKTWYQRLEQSQQASDRRYQAQLAALQVQNNGQPAHVPLRRRIVPTRVDKRKNSRYLWLVDAMRKLARKKEQQAFKQAESQRAAAQRKIQADTNQPPIPMLTPQQFSKKRYERDCQMAEAARQHRQKLLEQHQQRQLLLAKQAQAQQQQQGVQNAGQNQQRPGGLPSNMTAQHGQVQANGQQAQNINMQMQQQARQQMPVATRNGHLAVPQVNGQGIGQIQMRPNGQMPTAQDMQRMAQANAQVRHQFGQAYQQLPNGNMSNPGSGGQMTTQQQLQNNQVLLAAMQQQQQQQQQQQHQPQQNGQANHMSNGQQGANHQQISGSPSMPPPPTPQNHPQALSSGRVPAILKLQQEIRSKYPQASEDQVLAMATQMLKDQSVSSNQVRQNAMNAAAGISGGVAPQAHGNNVGYPQHQVPYQNNQQMPSNGSPYMNGDSSGQQAAGSPQQYAALLRQRQMQQMRLQQHSPVTNHAQLAVNGSPSMAHASPNMAPASPSMQFSSTMAHSQMNGMPNMTGMGTPQQQQQQQQRPPSRSNTPQMQRLGSSGSVPGMPSPQSGMQGSPHMQAGMAR